MLLKATEGEGVVKKMHTAEIESSRAGGLPCVFCIVRIKAIGQTSV